MRRWYDADLADDPGDPTARCLGCGTEAYMEEGDEEWILPEGWTGIPEVSDAGLCERCTAQAAIDDTPDE